jgi:mannose/fructose/N-acetylgalactosamine-specific phosphotransferase system component IID
VSDATDPVLQRRAKMARLAGIGRGIGWILVLAAVIAFVLGLAMGFDPWGNVVVIALIGTTVTLAPAIVLGYAVKAADREDREVTRRNQRG